MGAGHGGQHLVSWGRGVCLLTYLRLDQPVVLGATVIERQTADGSEKALEEFKIFFNLGALPGELE